MNNSQMDKYSFWWSEARMIIAAAALLLGGTPPVFLILPGLYSITAPLLRLAWLISGVAAIYLGYRWYKNGWMVFGGKGTWDMVATAIFVVTGLNLGFTGLSGTNIGMSIIGGRLIFLVAGIIYLVVAVYIYRRSGGGQRMF